MMQRLTQFLKLVVAQKGTPAPRPGSFAAVLQRLGSPLVVATHDLFGIVIVQANGLGRLLDTPLGRD